MYAQSSYHRLLHLFQRSFQQLGKDISSKEVESLCSIVHQVMSAREREFHTERHILDMSSTDSEGIETLSIAMHDVVYANIDRRIHPLLQSIIPEFVLDETYNLEIPEVVPPDSAMLLRLFRFAPKQKLTTFSGQNEFLSAVAAVRIFKDILTSWELVQMGACIEATRPFRAPTAEGKTPSDLLAEAMHQLNTDLTLGRSTTDIVRTVQMAVDVSNRDVSGFGALDPGLFLSGTWDLVYESNPTLRNPLYLASHYRNALAKMEGFLSILKPEVIFREYKGIPDPETFKNLLERAKVNLGLGVRYLQVKIAATDIICAICELTGGDAPIILFTGNVNSDGNRTHATLEHHLDQTLPIMKDPSRNPELTRLLHIGRAASSSFDLKHSPLAAYLFERIKTSDLEAIILKSKAFGTKQVPALDFIQAFPKDVMTSMMVAISRVAETRGPQVLELIKGLK